ncbi:hypothetical protein ACFPKZ_04585 [Streptosporangium amethystogenes subsp. fukuiense]|uniref:hypothetical protein n=1 Tax=Streptosporangium amethystogenes TaxID=2002 RepID=UPI003614F6F7
MGDDHAGRLAQHVPQRLLDQGLGLDVQADRVSSRTRILGRLRTALASASR